MRRFLFGLAAVTAMALTAGAAQAGDWHGGRYDPQQYRGGYGPYYYAPPAYGYALDDDPPSVARIKAAHSRYRYYTHPRSLYNSPPAQADYFGWQPGW
jgi:hypothetical protein